MRVKYLIEPRGWPCTLNECPPGPFLCDGELSFKTEYKTDGHMEVYNSVGEVLWAGKGSHAEVCKITVQPVAMERTEEGICL